MFLLVLNLCNCLEEEQKGESERNVNGEKEEAATLESYLGKEGCCFDGQVRITQK